MIINTGSKIGGGSEPPYGWTNTSQRAAAYADSWAQRMANDGFRDIIMTNPFSTEDGGRWTFLFRHAITDVTVELQHHGIDDLDAYMRQHTFAPRVYWNGSSCATPQIEDFAAKGFSAVITYRRTAMDDVLHNCVHCATVETLDGHSVVTTINDVVVSTARYFANETQVNEHAEAQLALFRALQQQMQQNFEAAEHQPRVTLPLPEPDVIDGDNYHYWDSNNVSAHPGDGVGYLDGTEMTVKEMEEFATQLLAAAAVADTPRQEVS